MTWVLIAGIALAGVTALPLQKELDVAARLLGVTDQASATSGFAKWIVLVRNGLHDTYAKHPFMGYGTDWLAFGHIVIAIAFVGALRHPLGNSWLFTWGMITCVLVIPWALICGEVRGIPMWWRFIDCSFGVAGFVPCWLAARWCRELERLKIVNTH
ncbi:MAG TPA: hypothetical protein VK530_08465 [Candidatus Acidoferrum sp.]|nr:hypothetical protein [Candidatus Acidoferrum sp.]